MRQKELAALLRAVADWLDKANSEDIKSLVEGKSRFTLEVIEDEAATANRHQIEQKFDLGIIRDKLEQAKSLEEGFQILRQNGIDKRKKHLEELAKSYEVGIRKSERMSDLAHRIVNAVIGSRLQVEITQNLSLGRGGET